MNLWQMMRRRGGASGAETRELLQIFETWSDRTEKMQHDFVNYVQEGYKSNGVVFGVILARLLLFSEARFKFRNLVDKRLFYTSELDILNRPWPNGTTGELLARMEQDVSLAGNAYVHRASATRLQRLRPDWVEIIGTPDGRDLLGYLYTPGGTAPTGKPRGETQVILPEDMAHWSPLPDPESNFRGMSWLTPVVREVNADSLMTRHKAKFFENAATPNLLVKVAGRLQPDQRKTIEERLRQRHQGWEKAYETLLLEGGADATIVGHSFEQMSFAATQAAGENRIASAGGVPGIIVGLKEGLDAATYSNYSQARRRFADLTMRPNWRSAAAALASIIRVPAGAELWYDDVDIPALKEDAKDAAEIFRIKAQSAAELIRVGYEPDEVGRVVETGMGLATLTHTGGIPNTLYQGGVDPKSGTGSAG